MRILIVLVSVVMVGGPGMAQTPQERARLALALAGAGPQSPAVQVQKTASPLVCACGAGCTCAAGDCGDANCPSTKAKKASAGCPCGASCTCTAGECGARDCPSPSKTGPGPWEWAVYQVQYNRAVRQNKPMLIWLGETCPACEEQWTEFVHTRLSEFDSPSRGTEKGPACVVCKPDGLGGMNRLATLNGIPTRAEVDALVAEGPVSSTPAVQTFRVIPMMRPMMMGGFGGGGGCGPGG